MTTIIYIHGFASGKNSRTASYFSRFGNVVSAEYNSADLFDNNFQVLCNQIEAVIQENEDVVIVGTSLGGFYAKRLADKFCVNSILINPVVDPVEVLSKFVGENINYSTGEKFILTENIIQSYVNHPVRRSCPCLVFVSKADELIENNVQKCISEYADKALIVSTETGHRISDKDIESFSSSIQELLNTIVA